MRIYAGINVAESFPYHPYLLPYCVIECWMLSLKSFNDFSVVFFHFFLYLGKAKHFSVSVHSVWENSTSSVYSTYMYISCRLGYDLHWMHIRFNRLHQHFHFPYYILNTWTRQWIEQSVWYNLICFQYVAFRLQAANSHPVWVESKSNDIQFTYSIHTKVYTQRVVFKLINLIISLNSEYICCLCMETYKCEAFCAEACILHLRNMCAIF